MVDKTHETISNTCAIVLWAREQSEQREARVGKKKKEKNHPAPLPPLEEDARHVIIISHLDSLHNVC
jgi:hypothetical protein